MLFFVIIKNISLSLRQHKIFSLHIKSKESLYGFSFDVHFSWIYFFVSSILTNIAGLQSFFALQSPWIISHFVMFQDSFFWRFSTLMGQFLHLRKKMPHRGVQGHTGASLTVNSVAHILSLLIARKARKCPTPLDIPLHKSLYTTSGSADFKQTEVMLWTYCNLFFLFQLRPHLLFGKYFVLHRSCVLRLAWNLTCLLYTSPSPRDA